MNSQGAPNLTDGVQKIPLNSEPFTPEDFPDCNMDFFTVTPCAPVVKSTGSIKLGESTPFFADNGLGNGAVVTIKLDADDKTVLEQRVWLTWIDWNEFEYESVGW